MSFGLWILYDILTFLLGLDDVWMMLVSLALPF